MGEVYIISDLHLGHKTVSELRGFSSVEEHDRAIIDRWNEVVTNKKDVVWVLGDVLFRSPTFDKLRELRGIKKLVLGNHDVFPLERYQQHFQKVYGLFEYDKCLLTHIPVSVTQFARYRLNIHGHMHARNMSDPRYVNVSAEQNDLRPQLLKPLLERWGARRISAASGCMDEIKRERDVRRGGNRIDCTPLARRKPSGLNGPHLDRERESS